ncbi:hypothetical protein J437_LFUL009692 [Ladona fulva]|uniref:GA-binding protein subunit beta-1 n=1 Tax=Ladona fulva TaxID=123851 RepID=A0A8K0K6E7_LADFU|nr:hypothetical protein J437_LFUL009692 [Ladona fulva]
MQAVICTGDGDEDQGGTLVGPTMLEVGTAVTSLRLFPNVSLMELGKKLLIYSKLGDFEQVRNLMAKGAPFTSDWLGTSPLHHAAQHGHLETAEALLRAGISRDARTKVDRTPLHVAATEGHVEIVKLLLKMGADVGARDMLHMTPLHWAVERQHLDVVEVLLQYGADPYAVSKFDKTPFSIALEIIQTPTTSKENELYLEHHIKIEPEDKEETRESSASTMKLLQAHGITMLPADESTLVASAMESGQTVVLTEQFRGQIRPMGSIVVDIDSGDTLAATQSLAEELTQVPSVTHQEEVETSAVVIQTPTTSKENELYLEHHIKIEPEDKEETRESSASTMKLLQAHGITMLPADESTLVASAMESGQTVVLTEAGKLALDLTKTQPSKPAKQTNMVNRKMFNGNQDEVETSINGNTSSDLAAITRKLEEAKRVAEEYREQLKKKEREAEQYKKQLLSITNSQIGNREADN